MLSGSSVGTVPVARPTHQGSRIAQPVETSNAESPTPMYVYIVRPLCLAAGRQQDTFFGLYIIHPESIHRCFVFDRFPNLRDSDASKPKR